MLIFLVKYLHCLYNVNIKHVHLKMKMMSTFKHPCVIPAWLGFNLPSKPDIMTISKRLFRDPGRK